MNIQLFGAGIIVAGLSAVGFKFGSVKVGEVSGGLGAVLVVLSFFF